MIGQDPPRINDLWQVQPDFIAAVQMSASVAGMTVDIKRAIRAAPMGGASPGFRHSWVMAAIVRRCYRRHSAKSVSIPSARTAKKNWGQLQPRAVDAAANTAKFLQLWQSDLSLVLIYGRVHKRAPRRKVLIKELGAVSPAAMMKAELVLVEQAEYYLKLAAQTLLSTGGGG